MSKGAELWGIALVALLLAAWPSTSACAQACGQTQCGRSRLVASLPFGAGQFQNGDDDLGWFFAASEGTLFGASILLWVLHEDMRDLQPRPDERDALQREERVLRYGNWAALGLFGATAMIGVIEAHATLDESEAATLAVGPGGARLSISF